MVPTDDRAVGSERLCCSATAGGKPRISVTFGAGNCAIKRLAYGAMESKYLRCASAKIVPKAIEDFPEPDTPVKTTNAFRGMSTSIPRKLFCRAPRTSTKPSS
jgi:hypothetical protein